MSTNPHVARAAGSGYGAPQHAPRQHAPAPQPQMGAAPAGAPQQLAANPHVIPRGYGGGNAGGNPFVQGGYGNLGAYAHQDDPPRAQGAPSGYEHHQQQQSMAAAYGDPGEVAFPPEETNLQWLADAHEGYEALGAQFGLSIAPPRPLTLFVAPRAKKLQKTSALQAEVERIAPPPRQGPGGGFPAGYSSVTVEPMPRGGGVPWFRVSAMGYPQPFRTALQGLGKVKTPDQVVTEADPPKKGGSWLWWGLGAVALIGLGVAGALFLL